MFSGLFARGLQRQFHVDHVGYGVGVIGRGFDEGVLFVQADGAAQFAYADQRDCAAMKIYAAGSRLRCPIAGRRNDLKPLSAWRRPAPAISSPACQNSPGRAHLPRAPRQKR